MIVTRLQGGLGNQMFQYAVAKSLAIKNKTDLLIDTASYQNYKLRNFGLGVFKCKPVIIDDKRLGKIRADKLRILKNWYFRILGNLPNWMKTAYIIENKNYFNSNILNLKDGTYLEGFWQSERYFAESEKDIRQDFLFDDALIDERYLKLGEKVTQKNSVSIHVRRTDYVKDPVASKVLGFCGLEYYQKAIKLINQKVSNPEFYVFSDDMEWVKQNLGFLKNVTFMEGGKDYEDLYMISKCRYNIIANSSFSWWGAWLNNYKDKIVIAPSNWYKDKSYYNKDLVPKSWITI